MVNYMQSEQGKKTQNGFEDADEKLIGCLLSPKFYLPSNTDDSIIDQWDALELPKIPEVLLDRHTPKIQNVLRYGRLWQTYIIFKYFSNLTSVTTCFRSLRYSIGHKTKSMPVCTKCKKHPGDSREYYDNRWILAESQFPSNIELEKLIASQRNFESQEWNAQGGGYACRCQEIRKVNVKIQFHDCADYVIMQIPTHYNPDGSRRIPDVSIPNTIRLPAEFFPHVELLEFRLTSVLCFQPKEIRNANGAVVYVDHWVAYRKESPGGAEAEVMMLFDDAIVDRHNGDVYRGASTIVFRKVSKVTRSSEKKLRAV
jgi:hypothetical protein